MHKSAPAWVNSLFRAACWILVGVALSAYFSHFFSTQISMIGPAGERFVISDFAYHVLMSKAYWFEGAGRVYFADTQLAVLRNQFGQSVAEAMPIGLSPMGLIGMLPFAWIARSDLNAAAGLWVGLSTTLLLASFGAAAIRLRRSERNGLFVFFVLILTSFALLSCLLLGQTSAFAASLLVLLFLAESRPEPARFAPLLILLFLCAKPPYALIGAGFLLSRKNYAPVAGCAAICAVAAGFFWIHNGPVFFSDYLATLRMYSSGAMPAVYQNSVVLSTTVIFSSAAKSFTDQVSAASLSAFIYLAFNLGLLIAALRSKPEQALTLATGFLAAYLLFVPYAGQYEDLLIWPLLAASLFLANPSEGRRKLVETILIAAACAVLLNHGRWIDGKPILALWILKSTVVGTLIFRRKNAESSPKL